MQCKSFENEGKVKRSFFHTFERKHTETLESQTNPKMQGLLYNGRCTTFIEFFVFGCNHAADKLPVHGEEGRDAEAAGTAD